MPERRSRRPGSGVGAVETHRSGTMKQLSVHSTAGLGRDAIRNRIAVA
jgi:hypothetical protein